ncbi:MAG TPA: hypothetical protein VN441_14885, partial [Syntrophomonas sp.]|nr:hypothetical protein [Syntrophomonas sp.]
KIYYSLFALHVFVGLGSLFGGLAGMINPQNPLGIPVEVLRYSPFSNFLIPAVILFVVIGLGNIVSAYMFRFKSSYQGYISGIAGCALVIWIVVQCIMMRDVVFLHVLYFIIGLIQVALSILILMEQRHN